MSTTDPTDDPELTGALRAGLPASAGDDWAAVRARFAARAVADGLVDVAYEDHESPVGPLRIAATPRGIVRLVLPAEDPDAVLEAVAGAISARVVRVATPALSAVRRELDEYFDGDRRAFDVPLDWALSRAFRREVLRATALIPYGTTASYRRVATDAGSANAVRAAGTALATNPLPILVPCHRVVRSDGGLGAYLGGVEMKERLLALEGAIAA
ncbi:methylated-DNA--[protein]-cysteine S-methyltransferase [Patulibacter sp. NPDC049589]|uniref:methylated-DNA--[protein]-cysteine S-methyltransferase n=1 Tax=Patulibacter sp. NPDC049589 TaxID=3154731 RepID=UPI003418FEEF